ncbi:hypothetical protein [Sediminicola luteus]|uniref:hypothetical protein n=1 Tax=Sediminicola luteus TaxID=319238 RepID=UPI001FE74A66|nr:hypothetical protein [Sediminicola luteus]
MFIYLVYTTLTIIAVFIDQFFFKHYANMRQILILIGTIFLEPILYHPINTLSYLKGYTQFLFRRRQKWGAMPRKGFEISS